jgi:hypothetical protein
MLVIILVVEEKSPQRKFSGTERDSRRNFAIGVDFGSNFERNFGLRVKDAGKLGFRDVLNLVFRSSISNFEQRFSEPDLNFSSMFLRARFQLFDKGFESPTIFAKNASKTSKSHQNHQCCFFKIAKICVTRLFFWWYLRGSRVQMERLREHKCE